MRWRILSQPKIHCKGNSSHITGIFLLSESFSSRFVFFAKSCKISKILSFYVMFNGHEDFNNSRKNKMNFRVELQSRELNLALRKTTIWISKFWGEYSKECLILFHGYCLLSMDITII